MRMPRGRNVGRQNADGFRQVQGRWAGERAAGGGGAGGKGKVLASGEWDCWGCDLICKGIQNCKRCNRAAPAWLDRQIASGGGVRGQPPRGSPTVSARATAAAAANDKKHAAQLAAKDARIEKLEKEAAERKAAGEGGSGDGGQTPELHPQDARKKDLDQRQLVLAKYKELLALGPCPLLTANAAKLEAEYEALKAEVRDHHPLDVQIMHCDGKRAKAEKRQEQLFKETISLAEQINDLKVKLDKASAEESQKLREIDQLRTEKVKLLKRKAKEERDKVQDKSAAVQTQAQPPAADVGSGSGGAWLEFGMALATALAQCPQENNPEGVAKFAREYGARLAAGPAAPPAAAPPAAAPTVDLRALQDGPTDADDLMGDKAGEGTTGAKEPATGPVDVTAALETAAAALRRKENEAGPDAKKQKGKDGAKVGKDKPDANE